MCHFEIILAQFPSLAMSLRVHCAEERGVAFRCLLLLRKVSKCYRVVQRQGGIRAVLRAIMVANIVRIASAMLPSPMDREMVSLVDTEETVNMW
jgi:hypothetical protein